MSSLEKEPNDDVKLKSSSEKLVSVSLELEQIVIITQVQAKQVFLESEVEKTKQNEHQLAAQLGRAREEVNTKPSYNFFHKTV